MPSYKEALLTVFNDRNNVFRVILSWFVFIVRINANTFLKSSKYGLYFPFKFDKIYLPLCIDFLVRDVTRYSPGG